jgi:hypothetical protein
MSQSDPKELGKKVATAMVLGVLDASPKLDIFSTWLMGITTGFLVILFTNFEQTVNVIKIGSAKALIVVLTISTVTGLIQKFLSLLVQTRTHTQQAAELKMVELAQTHSAEKVGNPVRYFQEHADIVHMLVLFVSAFPNWFQKRLRKTMFDTKLDLSDLRKYTTYLFWQGGAILFQLFCALITVAIMLFSL